MEIIETNKQKEYTEFKIAIEKAEWKKTQAETLIRISKNIKLPGFRPGMVPKNVIESKISKQEIISESIDKQLDKSIREFITSNKYENELNGTIESNPDVDIVKVDENELIFTARFPTIPSIELPDYKKLNIVVEDVEAAKEEVEHEFDRMIRKDIMLSSKEGPVAMGDNVNIDFKGFDGKKAFSGGEEKDYDLIIGSNSFIPGFEEQLIGMNDGETKTIKVHFPKNYHAAELAGKPVTFEVKINSISSVIKPEFTKEYFSKFKLENIDSEESFKDYLKKQLTDWKEYNQKQKLQKDISAKLIEGTKVSHFPGAFVNEEIKRIDDELIQEAKKKNMTREKYLASIGYADAKVYSEAMNDAARRNLTLVLAIEKLIEELGVKATEEEIKEHISKMAKVYNLSVEEVNNRLGKNLSGIETFISQNKVFDKLIELNK